MNPDWYLRLLQELGIRPNNVPTETDDDDWSPAPPDSYIALSDAEIEAAEAEDREFQTCHTCGELTEDCRCDE